MELQSNGVYVKRCPECGQNVAALVDRSDEREWTADTVRDWIQEGFAVDLHDLEVTVAFGLCVCEEEEDEEEEGEAGDETG